MPEVEQINPPPQEMERQIVGKLKPPDKNADKDKKKKAAKKAPNKKDGPPPKPTKWADGPPKFVMNTYHYLKEAEQDMSENIFPLNIRG